MIQAGIVGGAGYVGGEVVRLLLNHPKIDIKYVSSRSQAGKAIHEVHRDLLGSTDLIFSDNYDTEVDVLILCMGHGKSSEYLAKVEVPAETVIIDLSRDFRLNADAGDFMYGLCEMNKASIKQSNKIANPGCFATCIQLALLPVADAKKLKSEVHVTAITGSTGAGQKPVGTTHFSWRNNNISIYKPFTHQHLGEINQSVRQLQPGFDHDINFIPMRGDFTRGIFASVYFDCDLTEEEAINLYKDYYRDSPFVHVSNTPISVKDVVNTNNGYLFVAKHGSKLRVESAIDNLQKGAAGQAIQNLNLVMGFPEDTGLRMKPSAF